jgi:hypothetical protein
LDSPATDQGESGCLLEAAGGVAADRIGGQMTNLKEHQSNGNSN